MIDASDPEFIRLLARLKLSVRRQLEYNIDLARLQKDAQQALEVLKEKIADPSVEKNSSNVRSYRFGARGG